MEEETTMERKLVDVGHRVETPTDTGLVSDITHAASPGTERSAGPEAMGRDALQAIRNAAAAVGNGVQHRKDEVIAYARREPAAALTAAAGLGFLAGLALAIASRAGLATSAAGTVFGGRTGSGWRGVLGLK